MVDPISAVLTGIAAVKSAVSVGRQIQDLGSDLVKIADGFETLENNHHNAKKKASFKQLLGVTTSESDLESFLKLKKAKQAREELRLAFLESGSFSMWEEFVRFEARRRKEKIEYQQMITRKRRELFTLIGSLVLGSIGFVVVCFIGYIIYMEYFK